MCRWIAANIWNNQSRTADKGWSFGWGVGLTTIRRKNKLVTKCYIEPRTSTDSYMK
jgi:hypothetical protein